VYFVYLISNFEVPEGPGKENIMTHHEVYQQLLAVMKKRGGGYSGMDIPEFYAMAEELFTPAEAEVNNAMPRGPFTANDLAREMGRDEAELEKPWSPWPTRDCAWPSK
jgi:hypothetical protein